MRIAVLASDFFHELPPTFRSGAGAAFLSDVHFAPDNVLLTTAKARNGRSVGPNDTKLGYEPIGRLDEFGELLRFRQN